MCFFFSFDADLILYNMQGTDSSVCRCIKSNLGQQKCLVHI